MPCKTFRGFTVRSELHNFVHKNKLADWEILFLQSDLLELIELCKQLVANYQQREDVMNK